MRTASISMRIGTPHRDTVCELLLGTPLRSTAREARKHHNLQSKYLRAPLEGPACSSLADTPRRGTAGPPIDSSSPLSSRLFRCAPPADSRERLRIPENELGARHPPGGLATHPAIGRVSTLPRGQACGTRGGGGRGARGDGAQRLQRQVVFRSLCALVHHCCYCCCCLGCCIHFCIRHRWGCDGHRRWQQGGGWQCEPQCAALSRRGWCRGRCGPPCGCWCIGWWSLPSPVPLPARHPAMRDRALLPRLRV